MKECPGCAAALLDSAAVCEACGSRWQDDGTFVPGPRVDAPGEVRPPGRRDGRDTRDYRWVGDAAYVDAAGGPALLPFIVLWFVAGCIAALWYAIRETNKAARRGR